MRPLPEERNVFEMNDEQAFKVFKKVRWGDGKEVACPQCGVIHTRADRCAPRMAP